MSEPRVVSPRTRPPRAPLAWGRLLAPLATLAIGLLVGVAIASGDAAPSAASEDGLPSRIDAGIARGHPPSEAGARAAARAWLAAQGDDFYTDERRSEEVLEAAATSEFAAAMRRALEEIRAERVLEAVDPSDLAIRTIPIATRLHSFEEGIRATVDVWAVALQFTDAAIMRRVALPPDAEWARERYELVWEGGDWRIADLIRLGPGPTPDVDAAPTPYQRAARQLRGFEGHDG